MYESWNFLINMSALNWHVYKRYSVFLVDIYIHMYILLCTSNYTTFTTSILKLVSFIWKTNIYSISKKFVCILLLKFSNQRGIFTLHLYMYTWKDIMIFTIIFIVHLPHLPPGFTTMTIKNYIYVTHLELSYTKYKYNIYTYIICMYEYIYSGRHSYT